MHQVKHTKPELPDTYLEDLIESMAEMSLTKTDNIISKLTKSSNSSKAPSIELLYARAYKNDIDLAVAQRNDNVSSYQWQGNYWKALTKHDCQQHAFRWLENNFPDKVSAKLAAQCYQSAQFTANQLPDKPKENIVPLKDCWIAMGDDGSLTAIQPNRAYGITYQIGACLNVSDGDYQPAPLPQDSYFHRFLTTSLPDLEIQELVQQYCGYSLVGDTRHQTAQVWCGFGSNGKSILLKIMQELHQKTAAIRLDKMEQFGLASITDASLAVSAETPKRGINEQMLKACITSDPVVLESKGKNEFTYRPTAKWIIACNRFPRIQDETDGVFRRLQIINWKVQFDSHNRIDRLDEIIINNELHHVVNWCLAGLQRLLKQGKFILPASVLANTQQEKESSNTVLTFTQDYMMNYSHTGQTIAKEVVFKKYQTYCEEQGHMACGTAEFWSRMYAVFSQLKETKKRELGKQKRHVNLMFCLPIPETSQAEIEQAFKYESNNNQLTTGE
jgi:putative DNA primase/helicase